MVKITYTYSPKPMQAYRLQGLPADETTVIAGSDYSQSLWNLFWLSTPEIDAVPAAGKDWWRYYKPKPNSLSAMIRDVSQDEVLYRKLMMHPDAFGAWFEREDHTIYDCYDEKGGAQWAATVLARCAEATARMILEDPPVVITGNVVKVNFKKFA